MCRVVERLGFHPEGAPYEQAPRMLVQLYRRPTRLTAGQSRRKGEPSTNPKNPPTA
jgi:hypothetical protein